MQKLTFNLLPSTIEIAMKQQHENIFKKLEEGRTWRSLMYQLSVIINIFIFVCEHTRIFHLFFSNPIVAFSATKVSTIKYFF